MVSADVMAIGGKKYSLSAFIALKHLFFFPCKNKNFSWLQTFDKVGWGLFVCFLRFFTFDDSLMVCFLNPCVRTWKCNSVMWSVFLDRPHPQSSLNVWKLCVYLLTCLSLGTLPVRGKGVPFFFFFEGRETFFYFILERGNKLLVHLG